MKKQLEKRIEELKSEFETGQKTLADLQNQQASLRETLLRISGAIQVLEEELAKAESSPSKPEEAGDAENLSEIRSVG